MAARSAANRSTPPETSELHADGSDLAYIPSAMTDDAGIVKPLADRSVTVNVDGPAGLLGLGSAEPITPEGFAGNSHRTFNGRALAVVRAGHESGQVVVTVSAEGCEAVQVRLQLVSEVKALAQHDASAPAPEA
jgi:beta-galactosidase